MENRSELATLAVDFGSYKSNPRQSAITKITPHHMAGNLAADDCARSHLYGDREASANYYIDGTGAICAGVAEDRRCWASYSRENDHAAICIEVANSTGAPEWRISPEAYEALVALAADICTRYGITPHYTGTPAGSITMHKFFTETLCPGPYLEELITSGKFERDILARMNKQPEETPAAADLYRVQAGAFRILDNAIGLKNRIESAGFETYLVKVGDLYKVQTGAFKDRSNAENLVRRLACFGFNAIITTEGGIPFKPGTGKRSAAEVAKEVIEGKWGNDPERTKALTRAGYDAAAIQKEVNKILLG